MRLKSALTGLTLSVMLAAGAASAQELTGRATPECGTGPILQRFDLPRDEKTGDINFFNGLLDGYDEAVLQPVGAPICLKEDTPDIYMLNIGYGLDLQFPNKEAMIQVIVAMQLEAEAAVWREREAEVANADNS